MDDCSDCLTRLITKKVPQKSGLANTFRKKWCAREDLNLQSFRNQILSLARLPFRHARDRSREGAGYNVRIQVGTRGKTLLISYVWKALAFWAKLVLS